MTREEAIADIRDNIKPVVGGKSLDMAIKVLEQEHSNDAISRQSVLSMQYRIDDSATLSTRDVVNVDDIEDLPSVAPLPKIGRWIPVSERLPEHSGRYLVTALDGTDRRTTIVPYHSQSKTWTLTGRMAYWRVLAWMPLPEPYQPESEEKNEYIQ